MVGKGGRDREVGETGREVETERPTDGWTDRHRQTSTESQSQADRYTETCRQVDRQTDTSRKTAMQSRH